MTIEKRVGSTLAVSVSQGGEKGMQNFPPASIRGGRLAREGGWADGEWGTEQGVKG